MTGKVEVEAVPEVTRRCTLCNRVKPITSFPRNKKSAGGRTRMCRPCTKSRYAEKQYWKSAKPRKRPEKNASGMKILPPQQTLREMFDYDAEQGLLIRRAMDRSAFSSNRAYGTHLARWAGKPAFCTVGTDGYLYGSVGEIKAAQAHRVVYKWHYGEDPDYIDHIDGDAKNNRIENLRSVTMAENNRNRPVSRANKSGIVGVCRRRNGSWVASIKADYKTIHLGEFKRKEDAISARKSAEKKFGYHPNHGRRPSRALQAQEDTDG